MGGGAARPLLLGSCLCGSAIRLPPLTQLLGLGPGAPAPTYASDTWDLPSPS